MAKVKRLGCWNLNESCPGLLRASSSCLSGEAGGEGWGWWEGWRSGWSASVHTPTESICDLALASFAPPHAGNGGRCCVLLSFLRVSCICSCTSSRAPPSPLPSGGWKDCSDDHALSICWNRACFHSFHRPSCPCPSWFVVDIVTPFPHHMLKLILLPLRSPHLLHVPREGHRFDPALN
jgi:hypothetical protein